MRLSNHRRPAPQSRPPRQKPRRHRDLPATTSATVMKVAFEDKYLNTVVGTIVRINQRTATVDPGDGTSWRVGFALLRHVFDV